MKLKDAVLRVGRSNAHVQTLKLRTYMQDNGWVQSRIKGSPVSADGRPRAWLTIPALQFLENRVAPGFRVFEWGSGGSTQWWRDLGCEVTSCDHDAEWAARDPEVIHRSLDGGYVEEISRHGLFDLILVDGRRRVECIRQAVAHLTAGGVVIVDNCERSRYERGLADLSAQGFRYLPFFGLAPGSTKQQVTGVFYRDHNVLQL